ncbi:MAG: GAF domain-containing protein, partial [Deltaproteobacteria bacterium]|nr:GAF domain-containing protein [Deltaproteobacteria bacterium]
MEAKLEQNMENGKQQASYYKALHDISNQIHSAKDLDEILINLKDQILSMFDADRLTIYVVDGKRKEIYSRFKAGNIPTEIRVPISNQSIAGYTANNAQISNIGNAYDAHELAMINKDLSFDKSWDEASGYVTKQILTVPIFYKKYVIGVIQLINKKNGDRFTLDDQNSAVEMANVLGIAFFNHKKMTQQAKKRTKFDYLINNNIITDKELARAVSLSRERKLSIETIFIDEMKVKKTDIGRSLAEFYNCEYVPFDNNFPIPGDLTAKLKQVYLKNNLWVPLARENGKVKILIDNPQRLDKIDSVKSLVPAEQYEFAVGLKEDILQFLDYFYESPMELDDGSIGDILEKLDTEPELEDDAANIMDEDDSAIVQ